MSALRCPHSFVRTPLSFFFDLLDANGARVFQPAFRRKRRTGMSALRCPHSFVRTPLSFFFDLLDANGERVFQPALEEKADRNVRSLLSAFKTRIRNRFNKAGHLLKKRSAPRPGSATHGYRRQPQPSVFLPHLLYPQLNLPLLKDKQSPFLVP